MFSRFSRDPNVSRHPAVLTQAEARAEVRFARRNCRRVPVGHPYAVAPLWTPFWLAKLLAAVHASLRDKPARRRGRSATHG